MTSPFSAFVVALLLAAACLQLNAEEASPVAGWTEDFNADSWVERWVPYGRLADGTWAQGIEGPEEPQTDPAAGVDAKPKRQFKNDVLEQVSDRPITPLEWHDVLYEVKQRDVRVMVDGAEALAYLLPHEQPIQSFSLEVDGDKRTVGKAWFDEVAVEPLPRE